MANPDKRISELRPITSGSDLHEDMIAPISNLSGTARTFGVRLKAIKEWLSDIFKIEEKADKHPYLSLERIRSYFYRITFDTLPDKTNIDIPLSGACSSFVKDGILYRNLDWDYDTTASFEVHCKDFTGMAFVKGLNDGELDDSLISQLPYRIVDGVNDYGIKITTHILFNDWQWHGHGSMSLTEFPFYVLSNIKSMATIEVDLQEVLPNLTSTPGIDALGYLVQFLITDGVTTYVVVPPETAQGDYVLINATANPKLTNFRWVANETVNRSDLQRRPTGVERWNSIPTSLEDLRFTKAYESPTRLSEFIGLRDTTKDSTDAELLEIYNIAHDLYLDRDRDGQTWHSMHSVAYVGTCLHSIWVQEDYSTNYGYGKTELNPIN